MADAPVLTALDPYPRADSEPYQTAGAESTTHRRSLLVEARHTPREERLTAKHDSPEYRSGVPTTVTEPSTRSDRFSALDRLPSQDRFPTTDIADIRRLAPFSASVRRYLSMIVDVQA